VSRIVYLGSGVSFTKLHEAPEWAIGKRVRCGDCDSRFLVDAGDEVYADKEGVGWRLVKCPACGSWVFVYKRWWDRLT
jgi:DNA-directed RNA polymerase subunit RPC12/RpoP